MRAIAEHEGAVGIVDELVKAGGERNRHAIQSGRDPFVRERRGSESTGPASRISSGCSGTPRPRPFRQVPPSQATELPPAPEFVVTPPSPPAASPAAPDAMEAPVPAPLLSPVAPAALPPLALGSPLPTRPAEPSPGEFSARRRSLHPASKSTIQILRATPRIGRSLSPCALTGKQRASSSRGVFTVALPRRCRSGSTMERYTAALSRCCIAVE